MILSYIVLFFDSIKSLVCVTTLLFQAGLKGSFMKYTNVLCGVFLSVLPTAGFSSHYAPHEGEKNPQPVVRPNIATPQKQWDIWHSIPLHHINEAYDAIDLTATLIREQKTSVKTLAHLILKERVKNELNIKAIHEKIMEFETLQSFSVLRPLQNASFSLLLQQFKHVKNYFSRWIEPRVLVHYDIGLSQSMNTVCMEYKDDLDVAHFMIDALLNARGNPYAITLLEGAFPF